MRTLGIDPGSRLTGFGCVEGDRGEVRLIEAGVIRLCGANGNGSKHPLASRLAELEGDVADLLARLRPELVAVEALFAHYRHPATAITMGHARGVILLAIERAGMPLVELKPNAVKKALTGHGHAGKGQIQRAVQDLFRLPELPTPPDVADAVAIACCAAWRGASRGERVSAAGN